jgi:thiamine pyrophosphokinase
MSSHHIVREKQEPALLVLGLDHFSEEMLGQLLEWSPTVITTPLTAEQIDAFGIKIDIVIADETDASLQSDVKLVPPGGDTAIVAALKFLVAKGYPSVNIITDDLQLDILTGFAGQINLVIFYNGQKIYAIQPGFTKWKPAGENIRLLSASLNLQTTGLDDKGDGRFITAGDGFVTFTFNGPYIFIAEEI